VGVAGVVEVMEEETVAIKRLQHSRSYTRDNKGVDYPTDNQIRCQFCNFYNHTTASAQ